MKNFENGLLDNINKIYWWLKICAIVHKGQNKVKKLSAV